MDERTDDSRRYRYFCFIVYRMTKDDSSSFGFITDAINNISARVPTNNRFPLLSRCSAVNNVATLLSRTRGTVDGPANELTERRPVNVTRRRRPGTDRISIIVRFLSEIPRVVTRTYIYTNVNR